MNTQPDTASSWVQLFVSLNLFPEAKKLEARGSLSQASSRLSWFVPARRQKIRAQREAQGKIQHNWLGWTLTKTKHAFSCRGPKSNLCPSFKKLSLCLFRCRRFFLCFNTSVSLCLWTFFEFVSTWSFRCFFLRPFFLLRSSVTDGASHR